MITDADIEAIDSNIFHGDLVLLLDELRNRMARENDKSKRKALMERMIKVRRKNGWNISADLFAKDLANGEY